MKVCIEQDPATGGFSVYQEQEEMQEGMETEAPESMVQETGEQAGKQSARTVEEALQIAGQMLSGQPANQSQSAFDQGLKSVLPQRPGM